MGFKPHLDAGFVYDGGVKMHSSFACQCDRNVVCIFFGVSYFETIFHCCDVC